MMRWIWALIVITAACAPRDSRPAPSAETQVSAGGQGEATEGGSEAPAEPGQPEEHGKAMGIVELVDAFGGPPMARPTVKLRFGSQTDRLLRKLYATRRTTFYCGCAFDEDKNVDPTGCGFVPGERWQKRAGRIEWEHVVPADRMLEGRACATDPDRQGSPRTWCRKVDPDFRAMEADLHNLHPAIGQLKAERLNRRYGEVPGEPRRFGQCDFEVDDHVAEPKEDIRGDIARIYAYTVRVYGLKLTDEESQRLAQWYMSDFPTDEEKAPWKQANAEMGVEADWVEKEFGLAGTGGGG